MSREGIPFTETHRESKHGAWYTSGNGQLVFDMHGSDEHHLRSPATRGGQPLYDCRTYATDLIPKEWHEKRGVLHVEKTITQQGEVVSVTLSFVPTGQR